MKRGFRRKFSGIRWRAWTGRARIVLPVLAVASVALALNIWAYRHMGRLDLTSAGVYTITDQTRKVLATVEQPVQVTWFYDLRNKSMVDALALLEQYARENPKIQVRGVDPTVHPAEARRYGIQFAGSAVFESAQRTLTVNGGMETDFTNAIIRTTNQTVQTACFTHGHQEANPFSIKELDDPEDHDKDENLVARVEVHERDGMGMARDALETLGYRVRKVLLVQASAALDGCGLIIVAGPKRVFRGEEVARLRAYLDGGGKVMLLLEPEVGHGLQALLDDFGITHHPQPVLDEGSHYRSDAGSPASSDYPRHRITRNLPLSFFPGTSSFTPAEAGLAAGVSVAPLVLTSDRATLKGVTATPGNHTLMLLATRRLSNVPVPQGGKQATLLLGGDADFANNSYFALLGNGGLFMNAVNYLAQQEQLIDIQPRHYEGASVQLTNNQMRTTFLVSSVLLPLLALTIGALMWWRRR